MTGQVNPRARLWRIAGAAGLTVALVAAIGFGAFALARALGEASRIAAGQRAYVALEPDLPPSASFSVLAVDGLSVSVDGSNAFDPEGKLATLAWDFGDGGTANTATASHSYAGYGVHTITLTVTDATGATDSFSASVELVAPPPPPPPASSGDPDTCPPWTFVNSAENFRHTSCGPLICQTLTLPDPAHPECDYFYPPSYYW